MTCEIPGNYAPAHRLPITLRTAHCRQSFQIQKQLREGVQQQGIGALQLPQCDPIRASAAAPGVISVVDLACHELRVQCVDTR